MLLRICLILAILAGAAVIGVSHFQLRPHVQSIIDARNDWQNKYTAENKRANKLAKDLKSTQERLAQTEKDLKDTQAQLASTTAKLREQTDLAAKLKKNLDMATEELNAAKQQLAQWEYLQVRPDQVKAILDANKKMMAQIQATEAEKKILARRVAQLDAELVQWKTGREVEPPLPVGLKGKILVVDPKWNFVVLDIGADQGLIKNGVMMINRSGKLVGKVKVVNVMPNRAIANIMPGWNLGEVMEGDEVLY